MRRALRPTSGVRTALYLRVSTPDQKPDLQYDGLLRYAARAGLEVVRDYCDVAVSGRREGRPQLNALMTAARNREIDCVLVWKFDRERCQRSRPNWAFRQRLMNGWLGAVPSSTGG
jgi:DNA invertase Pin-like site-specific DNA recombinase